MRSAFGLQQSANTIVDPRNIANLGLWLDAADASTFTFGTGTQVSQWDDKSGNSRHATQSTAASRPVRTASLQNRLNIINVVPQRAADE